MMLTRLEIAKKIAEMHNLTQKEALKVVAGFFETLAEKLEQGYTIKFSRFGNFSTLNKSARIGQNPLTKEKYPIQARRTVKFLASKKFRELITNEHLK